LRSAGKPADLLAVPIATAPGLYFTEY
jgi:hypothetical protein